MDAMFTEIPSDFHSVETGEPFAACVECEGALTGFYIIEKAFVNGDALYEYALCGECLQSISEDLSKDSKRCIRKFLGFRYRKSNLDRCWKCKAPRDADGEHVICGAFNHDRMFQMGVPLSLCGACSGLLMESLSKQTRDRLDDFDREHFPGPPEYELDLPRPRRPVLI